MKTNSNLKIEDIPALCQPHCKIKDKARLEKTINELIKGGVNKLQVVSDFDFTITKQRLDNGEKVFSSFCMLECVKSLPPNYKEESNLLLQKYHPIEKDPTKPVKEKVEYMIEWWTKSVELLSGCALKQEDIDEVAAKCKDALRDGTHDLFAEMYKLNVPVLVFSAGLGNTVLSVLKQANVMFPNVKVVSNFLKYENGVVTGYQDRIIHTFNKNETALAGTEYYNLALNRDHIILMGDSLGDAGMANGLPRTSYTLKIGFLFDHVEQNLDNYMDTFDIVLIDDQTMDVPAALINLIKDA